MTQRELRDALGMTERELRRCVALADLPDSQFEAALKEYARLGKSSDAARIRAALRKVAMA